MYQKEGIMSDIIKDWDIIKDILKKEYEVSKVSFEAWIEPLKIDRIEDDTIYIVCESQLNLNYIYRKFLKPLMVVIEEYTGKKYQCELILPEQVKEVSQIEKSSASFLNDTKDNIGLNPSYTFETFVVGQSNRFARAAALAVADAPGEIYNPLFLYGGVGLGKTHLMQSVAHYVYEHNPNMKILYVSSETFTNELIEAIREGNIKISKFREKYRNIDVLLIDDIQFIIGKEATQEEFFHTFNELYNARKQIIITSDKPPKDMETLEERIRSRFECGLTADIGQPDYETRMAILRKKQEKDGINLNDEVLDYIAKNIKSNVRELEGALNKLLAFKKLTNTDDITIEIAQSELANVINPNVPKEITLQLIVEIVSEHFNITLEQMLSKARTNEIVKPRMIAMYLAKNLTNSSLEAIGAFLGGRDHSTIIHGINKIGSQIDNDPELKSQIEIIKNKISPG